MKEGKEGMKKRIVEERQQKKCVCGMDLFSSRGVCHLGWLRVCPSRWWKSSETRDTEARRDEETGQANRGELAVMQEILCWFGLPSRIEDRNKCAYQ